MPRIDPVKLLSCIGVLLSPNGGIRSAPEVKRLAGLMAKYSKKLVSKCIYIQILKCTDTELLGQFMDVGGWPLVHSWLDDGINTKNWPLVQELLELLLLCPVDVPRLQSNSAPKMVKGLSREEENEGVRILATRLVEQWLKIARGETPSQNSNVFNKENLQNAQTQIINKPVEMFSDQSLDNAGNNLNTVKLSLCESQINEHVIGDEDDDMTGCANVDESDGNFVFKITMKDGLAKISDSSPKKNGNNDYKESDSEESRSSKSLSLRTAKTKDDKKSDGKDYEKSKDHNDKHKKSNSSSSHRSSSGSKSASSSKHSSSSSSKSSSTHSKSHKSNSLSSSSSGQKYSSSSSSSSRDKHKSSSSKSSSSSSSSSKDKKSESSKTQAEKDKDTLAKIQPKSLEKVGKIPKKTNSTDGSTDSAKKSSTTEPSSAALPTKKKSISIEVRKDTETRPKTVKTYNSQFRSHGLAEEAPPPPSRRDLKKPATVPTNGIPVVPKRSLSPSNTAKEPEKRFKLATSPIVEKAGTIKLIPAKPKPSVLVESDMFMDAISAATTKKEVRKRKRIPSAKDSETSFDKTTATKDSKESVRTVTSAPLRFYQDTLEESENKEISTNNSDAIKKEVDVTATPDNEETKEKKSKIVDDATEEPQNGENAASENRESPEEPEEEIKREPGPGCGPNGPPGVLTIHRRRGPKKSLRWKPQESLEEVRYFELDETERVNVTKAFIDMKQMERVSEREAFLISRKVNADDVMTEQMQWAPLILVDDVPEHVVKSKEREAQAEREKTCLKTIYFNRAMIPDNPSEPDVITFQNFEAPTIPFFDITGNTDAIHDYTNMPWPEPKGSPPHQAANNHDDLNGLGIGFGQFNQLNWPTQNNMMNIRPPQVGLIMPPDAMNQINPMNMNPMHAFNAPNMTPIMGQLPPNNMAFMNNFAQGMHPIMNDNRGNRVGGGGAGNNWFGPSGVGGVGGNNAPNNNWQTGQMNNNSNQRQNWNTNQRRICKQFQRGFCRHGKNCKFLHPGENSGQKF